MVNRRSFLASLATSVAAFSILPSANTYERIWRPRRQIIKWRINPEWVNAPYEMTWLNAAGMIIPKTPVMDALRPRFKKAGDGALIHIPQFTEVKLHG